MDLLSVRIAAEPDIARIRQVTGVIADTCGLTSFAKTRVVTAVLEIALDDELEFKDYYKNLSRMFGEEKIHSTVGSVNGDVRFYGLTETNMNLDGIDRHQRLITSYQKLHAWRAAKANG